MTRPTSERRRLKRIRKLNNERRKQAKAAELAAEQAAPNPGKPVPQSVFCRTKRNRSSVFQGTYSALIVTHKKGETLTFVERNESGERIVTKRVLTADCSARQKSVDGRKRTRGSESHIECTDRDYSRRTCRVPNKRPAKADVACLPTQAKATDAKTGSVYYTASPTVTVVVHQNGLIGGQAKRVPRFVEPKIPEYRLTQSLRDRVNAIRKSSSGVGTADTRLSTYQTGAMLPMPVMVSGEPLPEEVALLSPMPIEKRQQVAKKLK